MRLNRTLRSSVAAVCIATIAAPAAVVAPMAQAAAGSPLQIKVGTASDFTRVEFHWNGPVKATGRREGSQFIVHFSRNADPDMSDLRVHPPKWLKTASARSVGGGLEITLTLADGADAKIGEADGATFVNLFEQKAPPPEAAAASSATAQPQRPDPVPASGVVRMEADRSGDQVRLRFPWKAPLGAAVFRRGDAIWIVFDARAKLDLSQAPKTLTSVQAVQGADFSAVRIASPATTPYGAVGEGPTWTVTIGPGPQVRSGLVKVSRDEGSASAALSAVMAGATKVAWVDDPAVGDRIAVVTALAPSKGLPSRREYVELALLPSVQGLAVEPYASDLTITADGDLVSLARPSGLALSPVQGAAAIAASGAPQPLSMPALIDFDNWGRTGSGGFLARYDALQDAAADEVGHGKDAGVAARMGLARFLVGSEMSFEAIGVLDLTAKSQPTLLSDAAFRGLRGAAKVMAGRFKEAETDFAAPGLAEDPSAYLWRGYISAKQGQWADARKSFIAGQQALNLFPNKWRARFARADALAALNLNDLTAAQEAIDTSLETAVPPAEQLETRLVQAALLQAQGHVGRALAVYQAVATAPQDSLSAPAMLHATQIKLEHNQITPLQAAAVYDGLRYRWRGDATELETIRALGQLYLNLGRYREALEALRSAGQRLPDLPEAVQLQADLAAAFRSLFLDGQADGLEPIQALALFFDFKELTPIGADGDLMVRKLARRLVDVDLLDQAADLLKYQVDNRLDGVPKADVATDLAMIQLMARKPEAALDAINSSRTTILPPALAAERRVLEARAWLGLGQYDHASEIVDRDAFPDAMDVKAEIAWKQHQWPVAGAMFEKGLGDRWKVSGALTGDEESKLLRAGVAFSLAKDDASLTRLHTHFQSFVAGARSPDALRVALAGVNGGELSVADFSKVVANNDSFAGWVEKMKQRFRDHPAPVAPPPSKALS